jgi:hypothetical protein
MYPSDRIRIQKNNAFVQTTDIEKDNTGDGVN